MPLFEELLIHIKLYNMKRISSAAVLLAIVLLSSCTEKFEDAKFRCKINGKDFIPGNELIQFTYTENQNNDYIRIRGTSLATAKLNKNPYGELEIKFFFNDVTLDPAPLSYDAVFYGNNEWDKTYRSSASDPGTVVVTSLDKTAKRVTANFELTLYADDSTTLVITEGFFDKNW